MPMHNPPHPGEILRNYLQDRTVTEVADHLGVTRSALSNVLNGRAGISAEMALRIGNVFSTDPQLWLRMQVGYDLWHASKKKLRTKPLPVMMAAAK